MNPRPKKIKIEDLRKSEYSSSSEHDYDKKKKYKKEEEAKHSKRRNLKKGV